jgi:hypothetical protein
MSVSIDARVGSPNAWPGGHRSMACLRCEERFVSTSKVHRLCDGCRLYAATRRAVLVMLGLPSA